MSDLALRILLQATDQASGVVGTLVNSLGKGGLAGVLAGVSIAAAGVAVAMGTTAVKAAGDFQAGLTNLVTGAGELQSNLGMVSDGIKNVAIETGTSTKDLISAMFMIDSSGKIGAQGLNVLRVAAQGAKTDNADLTDVAKALTGVLTGYKIPASQATSAMNELIVVSQLGKMHMGELAKSMGSILLVSHNAKLSFADVGTAISMMTNVNVPAQQAAQNLAFALRSLEAPSGVAMKSMAAIRLKAQDLKDSLESKGLPAALQLIEEHLGQKFPKSSIEYTTALKNIMGGKAGLNVALALGGENLKQYTEGVNKANAALHAGGTSVENWAKVQQTFNSRMAQAHEVAEVLMINIGTALLPVVLRLFDMIAGGVTIFQHLVAVGANVVHFFQQNQVAALALLIPLGALGAYLAVTAFYAIAFASVAIPGLIAGFIGWATTAGAAAIAQLALIWPILLIGAAIGLLIGIIVLLVTHWSTVVSFLSSTWASFSAWVISSLHIVGTFFASVWSGIVSGLRTAWSWVVGIVQSGLAALLNTITAPFRAIGALFVWLYNHNLYVQALCDTIRHFFTSLFSWATAAWTGFTTALSTLWNGIKDKATAIWSGITGTVQDKSKQAGDFLHTQQTALGSWLFAQWKTYGPAVTLAWQQVTNAIRNAWGAITGVLSTIWNGVSGWFSNLASSAFNWGANLIGGFINGIKSMLGNVASTAQSVAQNVASFLGFHSPAKEGPGRELMTWGPGLIKGFSQSVQSAMPILDAQMKVTAQHVADPLQGRGSSGTSASAAGGVTNIYIQFDGRSAKSDKDLADMVVQELSRNLRRSGNLVTWSSGGRS